MQQGEVVQQLIDQPTILPVSEIARRAGVNRSTIHRIAAGRVDPALATLRELAIVHGMDLDISLVPLSDPDAASAARYLLDAASVEIELSPGIREWIERLNRLGREEGIDPYLVLATAARASSLLHRRGARLFRGEAGALRLASAGDAAGGDWAVSGKAAIEFGREGDARGPSVLWVDDVARASRLFADTHKPVVSPLNAHVIVAEANPTVFTDAYTAGAVRYVAPIQMLLDCIGFGGELEAAAETIAQRWSE